jgi:hypothetical protein
MRFAPEAFRSTRLKTTKQVEDALLKTKNLTQIQPDVLKRYPGILPMLRMATCPPVARDRLIGLASVSPNLVRVMEENRLPGRMEENKLREDLKKIGDIILKMADKDIFPWLEGKKPPKSEDVVRAATIVADRLCGAISDPIIRNAQERRQLAVIKKWLESKGYNEIKAGERLRFDEIPVGTFAFRLNVPVDLDGKGKKVNIPIDTIIMPKTAARRTLPVLIEAKSAGDFTNTNKRRKEEAMKISQLRKTYGKKLSFNLFLCGYFDSGYLGYEAAEGIDWIWEHRIDDLAKFGL